MTRLNRHLLVVVGLVALTAVAISLPRGQAHARLQPGAVNLPDAFGRWTAQIAGGDQFLPIDRRSPNSVVRLYDNGDRRAWLGVSQYTGDNGPDRRPHVDALIPERGVTAVERVSASVPMKNAPALPATRLTVTTPSRTVHVWYWYRLGSRTIGDEYRLRFWMGMNAVLGRSQPLLLVRVATVEPDVPVDFVEPLVRHFNELARSQ